MRIAARKELVAIGPAAVPALCDALDDLNQRIQWDAGKILAIIGDARAAPRLAARIADANMDVRLVIAEALAALGKEGIAALLEALIRDPESENLRRGTHHVAHMLLTKTWAAPLRGVIAAIDGTYPNIEIPIAAHAALAQWGKPVHDR